MKLYTILPLEPRGKYNPTIPQTKKIYNDLGINEGSMVNGEEIKNWDNNNSIYIKGDILEDYMDFSPFIMISTKIKDDMEKEGISGVEYFPIKLEQIDKLNNIIEGYYVINILNMESDEVINQALSRKDPWSYVWVGFHKKSLKGHDIFRVKSYKFTFFISEKIKKIIDKYVHSVSFEEVEIK